MRLCVTIYGGAGRPNNLASRRYGEEPITVINVQYKARISPHVLPLWSLTRSTNVFEIARKALEGDVISMRALVEGLVFLKAAENKMSLRTDGTFPPLYPIYRRANSVMFIILSSYRLGSGSHTSWQL